MLKLDATISCLFSQSAFLVFSPSFSLLLSVGFGREKLRHRYQNQIDNRRNLELNLLSIDRRNRILRDVTFDWA